MITTVNLREGGGGGCSNFAYPIRFSRESVAGGRMK